MKLCTTSICKQSVEFIAIDHSWSVQVFHLPATRLPWYWLGIRSIGRESFEKLLATGNSVALVPGGVSECMVMKQGKLLNQTPLL